jgi:UDP-N-acetylglucosamine 2-epimerase (non-hydrolysing)
LYQGRKVNRPSVPKRILSIFGTRPEAIKLAPIIKKLEEQSDLFKNKVCITGQHREMLDQVLHSFSIIPDYDLDIMKPNQDLLDVTSCILLGLKNIFSSERPDWVLVQGDTTTAVAGSLAAFYSRIKIGHVEAGLRSHNKYAPFPEEINRRISDVLSDLYFVPTEISKSNLLNEGISESKIIVSGNTVIDALLWILPKVKKYKRHINGLTDIDWKKRMILVTGHRRESFGDDFEIICYALSRIATLYPHINIIYPVHLNPNVQAPVYKILGNSPNIHLIPPQTYEDFVWLMTKAYLILTDSGGLQEEGPALDKPVLVMRRVTERPEGITTGTAKLAGIDIHSIVEHVQLLLEDQTEYMQMAQAHNPYGDGRAASRIVEALKHAE